MTATQTALKKYVVKLSDEERERLNTLIRKGKHRARQLLKARILLKAEPPRPAKDGVTAGSPRLRIRAPTRLPGPASNWWRKASVQR